MSEGPAAGPNGMMEYLNKLDALFKAAKASADPMAATIDGIIKQNWSPAITQLKAYDTALKGLATSFKSVAIESANLKGSIGTAMGAGATAGAQGATSLGKVQPGALARITGIGAAQGPEAPTGGGAEAK